MPTTTPWAIPYPDGPTNLTALQSHFANIANAVNTALTTGLGGAPRIANSDAERLSILPAPVQGNTVLRPDKGYSEQYYGLYNAGSNIGGATPAGWYPSSGAKPHTRISVSAVAPTGTEALFGSASFPVTLLANPLSWWSGQRFTPTISGVYRLTLAASFSGVSGTFDRFIKARFNATSTPLIGISGNLPVGNSPISGSGIFAMNGTTDYFDVSAYTSSASVTINCIMSFEFIEPNR